jgi:hypothetical protein
MYAIGAKIAADILHLRAPELIESTLSATFTGHDGRSACRAFRRTPVPPRAAAARRLGCRQQPVEVDLPRRERTLQSEAAHRT